MAAEYSERKKKNTHIHQHTDTHTHTKNTTERVAPKELERHRVNKRMKTEKDRRNILC